jgi:hypothetical protein
MKALIGSPKRNPVVSRGRLHKNLKSLPFSPLALNQSLHKLAKKIMLSWFERLTSGAVGGKLSTS